MSAVRQIPISDSYGAWHVPVANDVQVCLEKYTAEFISNVGFDIASKEYNVRID
jgi:hypothetical protein